MQCFYKDNKSLILFVIALKLGSSFSFLPIIVDCITSNKKSVST